MLGNNTALVLCLGVLAAIGLPVLIYMGARGGSGVRAIDIFKRGANIARNPWQQEDENLEELSRRVEHLNRKGE